MAKRRINTTFLGWVFAVIIVIAAGLFAAKKFLHKENPQPYIAAGDAYFKSGDWDKAAANYVHASLLLPKDSSLAFKAGLSYFRMGADDSTKIRDAANEWRRATELNPDNKEAWQALLEAYEADLQRIEAQAKNDRTHDLLTTYYTLVRSTAGQLIRLAPDDKRVQSIIPELNIRMWLLDLSLPLTETETTQPYEKRPTDDQKINTAVAFLTQLLHDDPSNSQAAWWIARAKMHQAEILLQGDQKPDAYALVTEASKVFDDAILQNPPNVIELYLNQVQVLAILQQADPRPEMHAEYGKRLHESLEKAQAIVDPKKTQQYIAVKLLWARDVQQTDQGRAEQIYNDVIAKNPSDMGPKVELAQMLKNDVTRRNDAMAILAQIPDEPPAGLSDSRRDEMKARILLVKLLRAEILTTIYASAPDSKDKNQLIAQIQRIFDDLDKSSIEKWRLLKDEGRFKFERGQYRDAIQTLTAANDALSNLTSQKDSELLLLLAEAERHGEQTGNAINMLTEALKDPHVANTPGPHLKLAELYLLDHNIEKARPHIDWLSIRFPDNPDVLRLQIRAMNPTADHDDIFKLYQKLPETNRGEMVQKMQMAREINARDEVDRLLRAMHASAPDDVTLTYQLGMELLATGQKDEAKKVSDEALKAKPQDATLQLLADAVNGDSSKDIGEAVRRQVESMPDPFTRESKLAELSRMEGRNDEELEHLKAASKIQPTNDVILERIFLWYLAAGQFDNAEEYVARLGALDADQAHGQLYKFRLTMARGDVKSALEIGRQLTIDFKEFSESWESLGEALQASGQLESAATKYVEALNLQATNLKALRNLIDCSYQLGKLDDAKRYIQDAQQKFPDDPNYKRLAIEHELRYGDPETVLDTVRNDVKQAPDNAQTYEAAAVALLRAASLKFAKGDQDTAKAHLAEARQILQTAVTKWPDSIALVSEFAGACAQAGDPASGETAIKALADRPRWKTSPGPTAALADFYIQTNRFELAEAPLRDVLAKTNNSPDLEVKLAQVLFDERKFEPALAVLEQHQDLMSVRKLRTECLLSLNRGPQAETEIEQAIKAAPTDRQLNKLLLYIEFGQGQYEQVRKLASDSITADATNLPAYYYRALSNMQGSGDLNSAISDLTFVRDQTADNLDARLALATAKDQKGDLNGAITELEGALRAFPQNKMTRLRLLEGYERSDPPRWLDAERLATDGLGMPQFTNDVDLLRAAAVMYSRRGDGDKALTNIRAAMVAATDKSPLIHDYLTILLMAKQYDLLLKETDAMVAAPNAPWWVYAFRGDARARGGDTSGATSEFTTAMNVAGAGKTHEIASLVVREASAALGVDKTLELVLPRTQNSTTWKLVAMPLLDAKGDRTSAVQMAEAALANIDTLAPNEQDELLAISASLYLTSNPPSVDKAVQIYQKMIARHQNDYISMNNLACVLAEAKPPRLEEALKYANQAYELVKATGHVQPLVYDTEGWVLILSGQVDDGLDVLHRAIDQSDFPDAHYHLAEGYLSKKLPEDAQRELDNASDLIDKANAAKRPVDATLTAKIADARDRAKKMIADKTQAVAP